MAVSTRIREIRFFVLKRLCEFAQQIDGFCHRKRRFTHSKWHFLSATGRLQTSCPLQTKEKAASRPAAPCLAAPRIALPVPALPGQPRRATPRLASPSHSMPAAPCLARPSLAIPGHALPARPGLAFPSRAWPRHALPCQPTSTVCAARRSESTAVRIRS